MANNDTIFFLFLIFITYTTFLRVFDVSPEKMKIVKNWKINYPRSFRINGVT